MATQATDQLEFDTKSIDDDQVEADIGKNQAIIEANAEAVADFNRAVRKRKELLGVESLEQPTSFTINSPAWRGVLKITPNKRVGYRVDDGISMSISAEKA